MRNKDSYMKKYGNLKLYTLLQREANLASQIAKLKKKTTP